MDVSIIIVSFNTRALLLSTIASIMQHTKSISYEIIVVDNNSDDCSLEYVKTMFPTVITVQNTENQGFGRANNLGAKYAKGDYLFFLNSDTLLVSDAISELYFFAKSNKEIGAVGANLLKEDAITPNLSWGYFPTPLSEIRYIWAKLRHKSYGNAIGNEPFSVDFICGADLMVERSYFIKIGGFDNNIFLYYEETDLQKRMALDHRGRIILPTVKIIHLEGGSFGGAGLTYNRFYNSQISYNYYVRKHYKGLKYVGYRLFMCILRFEVLFTKKSWSLKERIKAYQLVLSGTTANK